MKNNDYPKTPWTVAFRRVRDCLPKAFQSPYLKDALGRA
jgi:hypothetical protein